MDHISSVQIMERAMYRALLPSELSTVLYKSLNKVKKVLQREANLKHFLCQMQFRYSCPKHESFCFAISTFRMFALIFSLILMESGLIFKLSFVHVSGMQTLTLETRHNNSHRFEEISQFFVDDCNPTIIGLIKYIASQFHFAYKYAIKTVHKSKHQKINKMPRWEQTRCAVTPQCYEQELFLLSHKLNLSKYSIAHFLP
jgi:hypothetical protein